MVVFTPAVDPSGYPSSVSDFLALLNPVIDSFQLTAENHINEMGRASGAINFYKQYQTEELKPTISTIESNIKDSVVILDGSYKEIQYIKKFSTEFDLDPSTEFPSQTPQAVIDFRFEKANEYLSAVSVQVDPLYNTAEAARVNSRDKLFLIFEQMERSSTSYSAKNYIPIDTGLQLLANPSIPYYDFLKNVPLKVPGIQPIYIREPSIIALEEFEEAVRGFITNTKPILNIIKALNDQIKKDFGVV